MGAGPNSPDSDRAIWSLSPNYASGGFRARSSRRSADPSVLKNLQSLGVSKSHVLSLVKIVRNNMKLS